MRQAIAHGGRLVEARSLFPDAPQPFIDLSTGINPSAYPLPDLLRFGIPGDMAAWDRMTAALG